MQRFKAIGWRVLAAVTGLVAPLVTGVSVASAAGGGGGGGGVGGVSISPNSRIYPSSAYAGECK